VVGFGIFGSGREAYALRADWRHDGRASERASERKAWRQSTEGAFMVDAVDVRYRVCESDPNPSLNM
jgi:hypothetical protein